MSGNNNPEDSDEVISQYLEDLGMLEEGMTSTDKRNLWAVIKISKDTAQAEEQDRQKRARRTMQFEQVSSRSETLSSPKVKYSAQVEKVSRSSPQKTSDAKDEIAEEERTPVVAAVSPQLRMDAQVSITTGRHTTATIIPICHSSDMSQGISTANSGLTPVSSSSQVTVATASPNRQVGPVTPKFECERSQPSPRQIMPPSARRALRSRTGESSPLSGSQLGTLDSTVSVVEAHEPGGECETLLLNSELCSSRSRSVTPKLTISSDKPGESGGQGSSSSSPVPVVESSKQSDHDDHESPMSSEHESSPVRKISQRFSLSLNIRRREITESVEKSEVRKELHDDKCVEESHFSALNDQTENMEKEKSASSEVTSGNVPSQLRDSLNEAPGFGTAKDVENNVSEDRDRNIDAFNCDRSNYGRTLKIRKVKRACSRLPFYIPPHRMDIDTYIAYFKRCINEHAARLIEVQRRNRRYVPWGDPVVVGESNTRALVDVEQEEQKRNSLANLQRYNFRDRKVAHQKVDTIFEDPDVQSDDDMFVNNIRSREITHKTQEDSTGGLFDALLEEDKRERQNDIVDKEEIDPNDADNSRVSPTVVDRQGSMKRKSDSSDDQIIYQDEKSSEPQEKRAATSPWLSSKKEDAPAVAVKRKKLGPVIHKAEAGRIQKNLDDEDFEPTKKERKCAVRPTTRKVYKRNKTSGRKLILLSGGGMEDESDLLAELNNAEDVGDDSNSVSQQESDIVRPGPIKLRKQGRRRVQQMKEEAIKRADDDDDNDNDDKQAEATAMDDITVLYDAGGSGSNDKDLDAELVPCPICRKTFPSKDIEAHASECNEYCEEEIPPEEQHISPSSSPEMVQQSPQSMITQERWSEFESRQGFERQLQTRQDNSEDGLHEPTSSYQCFVPISEQHDTEIDYHHQFDFATTSATQRTRTRKIVKKRKRRKRKTKAGAAKRRKVVSSVSKAKSVVSAKGKVFEDAW